MRFSVRSVLAAAVLAVVLAGCGGGGGLSNDDYAAKLKAILSPLGTSLQALGTQAKAASSKTELEAALRSGEGAIQTAIDGVNSVEPPSDAADAHQALLGALNSYKSSIAQLESVLESGSNPEIRAAANQFQADSTTFASTLQDIKSQLEDVGVNVSGG